MNIKTKIVALDHQGRGIAHLNGKVIFVPNALPDEIVEIQIIYTKRKYAVGKVIRYIHCSDQRIKPTCPYYEKCGGCHLSHLNYQEQIKFKQSSLVNIIKKYTKLDINAQIIISNKEFGYRNKVTLKIVANAWGYYEEESHAFIKIDRCLLAKEAINKIIANQSLFNIANGEIMIRTNCSDEIMISINTKDKIKIDLSKLTRISKIIGIMVNDRIFYGEDNFTETVNNIFYKVNYNSFFQVNLSVLNEVLKILNRKQYKKVLDIYCGVGTLGLAIQKEKLYGIEIAESSIKNALINNKINKQNAHFILGDSSKIEEISVHFDVIIIDPPRSGINKATMQHLINKKVDEIIYMSCNPLTLARDLNNLKEYYKLENIYLLDMFPQTHHNEILCFLTLNPTNK